MAEPRIPEKPSATGLSVCPSCSSGLVQPIAWAPAALSSWQVDLRCPNCEWHGRAIATQDEVDDFDVALDDGARQMNQALLLATGSAIDAELDRLLTRHTLHTELPSQRQ